jgi:hypothetical protein
MPDRIKSKNNGLPRQGTTHEILANSLTNMALATRLRMIEHNRRTFSRGLGDAFLAEAARRLYWLDAYEAHITKGDS